MQIQDSLTIDRHYQFSLNAPQLLGNVTSTKIPFNTFLQIQNRGDFQQLKSYSKCPTLHSKFILLPLATENLFLKKQVNRSHILSHKIIIVNSWC